MKFFRRFARHIRDGFKGFSRHLGMSLSSATAVTITLLLIGFFVVLTSNLYMVTNEIESSISLSALVSYDSDSPEDIKQITNSIISIKGVSKVDYRTKDQEFDFYIAKYPEMSEFYEMYRNDNPFHDAFIISLVDGSYIQTVKNRVEKVTGIESVHDGGSNTYLLVDVLDKVRIFGFLLIIILTALAIYLIYNTIKITISSRNDEIVIMKQVGAKNGYIRSSFLVEGIIIGLIGSIIPITAVCVGYCYLFNLTNGSLLSTFTLIEPVPFIVWVSVALLSIGVIVGFIGSYISVCRHLWRTR